MNKRLLTLLLLLVTSAGYSQVQLLKNEEAVRAFSQKISGFFKEGRLSECFVELHRYWPLTDEELGRIETQSISQLTRINQRFGQPIRCQKIKEEKVSDIALRETYIIQYQYTAIRMVFTYYHNPEGWIVHAFQWDDSFTGEFK